MIQFALIALAAVAIIYVVYKISYSDYYLEDGAALTRTRFIAYGIMIIGIIWIFFFDGVRRFDQGNYLHLGLTFLLFLSVVYLDMVRWYSRMDRRAQIRPGSIGL